MREESLRNERCVTVSDAGVSTAMQPARLAILVSIHRLSAVATTHDDVSRH